MDAQARLQTALDPASLLALPQEGRYHAAVEAYGRDIARFVAGYERSPERRQELLQEVHLALWESFAGFKGDCSLRTWVYRVAHNACATHVQKSLRILERDAVGLDAIDEPQDDGADPSSADRRIDLQRVLAVVHTLPAVDRQVMLLYLEDLDAEAIAEVTGLSARNVATKVHRLKALLAVRLAGRSNPR